MTESTEAKEPEIVDEETPVERQVREEDAIAERMEAGLIDRMQARSPETWRQLLKNRQDQLDTLRDVSISRTAPQDWTLFKDRQGQIIGVPRDSGIQRIKKWMGISISDYRPKNDAGDAEPLETHEDVGDGDNKRRLLVVTMIANGRCATTGEEIHDVRFSLREDMQFTGRQVDASNRVVGKGEKTLKQDLISAVRTGLDAKIVRLLADVRKVPGDVLKQKGIDLDYCYKGHGFGDSKDRGAESVSDADIRKAAKDLGDEIMRRVNGDAEAAKKLCVDITANPDKKFKGFDSVLRFTKQWQVDNAWKKLKAHEVFGDSGESK